MTKETTRRCVLVRITGRVQGVGFRAWTQMEARRLGLNGWVRNRPGGVVEAVIAGSEEAVSAMLDAFMSGPDSAVVDEVIWELADDEGPGGFRILP